MWRFVRSLATSSEYGESQALITTKRMALSDQINSSTSLRTALEFNEALRTELRRKVNDARKVKKITPDSLSAAELKRHDEAVILLFLE